MQILFAEADAAVWTGASAVIGTLINAGFAGLVGWYLLTKAIPKTQDEFTKVLREQQEKSDKRDERISQQFTQSIKEQQEKSDGRDARMAQQFTQTIKEQQEKFDLIDCRRREESKDALEAVMAHCDKEMIRRDDSFRIEMGLVQAALKDTREALEEVRVALSEQRPSQPRRRPTNP